MKKKRFGVSSFDTSKANLDRNFPWTCTKRVAVSSSPRGHKTPRDSTVEVASRVTDDHDVVLPPPLSGVFRVAPSWGTFPRPAVFFMCALCQHRRRRQLSLLDESAAGANGHVA